MSDAGARVRPAGACAVRLRPVAPGDHAVLLRLRTDVDLMHLLLANPGPEGDADIVGWVGRREASGRLWAVADAGDDACLGFVQLDEIMRTNATAWLGIALAPEARGQGAGAAAMAALETEARAMRLRKLLLEARSDNAGAIGLYERLGYRRVGVMREHYDDSKRLHDVLVMEKLLAAAP